MIETERRTIRDFLASRRSPKLRSLCEPAPSGAELHDILTIAARVPDHGKLVPWRFVVIRGDRREALNQVIGDCLEHDQPDAPEEVKAEARRRMTHAPLVVAVVSRPRPHPKVPEWEQILSAGAACMNLLHAARAYGFAGNWLSEWYAFDTRVLEELGLCAGERLAGFIHLGTPEGEREDRVRPDLDEIVSHY